MKIRTITLGTPLDYPIKEDKLTKYVNLLTNLKTEYATQGWEVQTIRLSTQPWETYAVSKTKLEKIVATSDKLCHETDLDYVNLGTTFSEKNIPRVYDIISSSTQCFSSAMIAWNNSINYAACTAAASLIKKMTPIEPEGFANLRFAALAQVKPNGPFFPASYHQGKLGISIGTENSDIVYTSFHEAETLAEAAILLETRLNEKYRMIQRICADFCERLNVQYFGIDPSICTSIHPNESIAFACEQLDLGHFGDPGTLAAAQLITSVVQSLEIKACGYQGLMLPVMEDYGLAQRNLEEYFDITKLLAYSAVCGTGLDTIPLPGNISEKKLYAILLDLASLSKKLQKPLSARLMPIPDKDVGDMTDFNFSYFVNSKIMKV